MKYLKRFNENNVEYFKPLLDSIKDILADVEDLGFVVYFLKDPNGSYTDPSIGEIYITKDHHVEVELVRVYIEHNPPEYGTVSFKYKDIKDNIEHLIKYMKQEMGYNDFMYQDIYTGFNNSINTNSESNILPEGNDTSSVIKMTFYKPV